MNKPGTGIKRFGTKTCFVAPNREVFTTYPGGWVGEGAVDCLGGAAAYLGGAAAYLVYELKIRFRIGR